MTGRRLMKEVYWIGCLIIEFKSDLGFSGADFHIPKARNFDHPKRNRGGKGAGYIVSRDFDSYDLKTLRQTILEHIESGLASQEVTHSS